MKYEPVISMWVGRALMVAVIGFVIGLSAAILWRAGRDTLTMARNARSQGIKWWQWPAIPFFFFEFVWDQVCASCGGYKIEVNQQWRR